MWILGLILGVLLLLTILLVILLIVPVDLVFRVGKGQGIESKVRIEWLFGLIGKDIRGKEKKPKEKEKVKKKREVSNLSLPFCVLVDSPGGLSGLSEIFSGR